MPTVYFKTIFQNSLQLPGAVSEDYYLKLLLNETISCLNSNGISYEVLKNNEVLSENIISDLNSINDESIILSFQINPQKDNAQSHQLKILFKDQHPNSKRLATILSENIKKIYSGTVVTESYSSDTSNSLDDQIPEIKIILEGFLNPEDITWIRQNMDEISKQLIISLDEYFGLPFVACEMLGVGMAKSDESLRKRPSLNSEIVGSIAANNKLDVLGQWEDWYIVGKNHNLGYVQTKFVEL